MNASIPRDEFGILSSKNTVSKYWGVSKKKDKFTVRFMEKVNKEIITFKPKNELSEQLCARIATRFFEEPDLYSNSTVLGMIFPEGCVTVNTCNNTLFLEEIQEQEVVVAPVQIVEEAPVVTVVERKVKKEKVVDHFRSRVNEIMLEALGNAKAKLAAQNAIYL